MKTCRTGDGVDVGEIIDRWSWVSSAKQCKCTFTDIGKDKKEGALGQSLGAHLQ